MPTWGPATSLPTEEVTSTTKQLSSNVKYYVNSASRCNMSLPDTLNPGDTFPIRGIAGGWRVVQRAGQIINGNSSTTQGVTGYLESQTDTDCITLEVQPDAASLKIINPRGTLTYG